MKGGGGGVVLLCHAYRSLSPTAPGDPPSDHALIKKKNLGSLQPRIDFFLLFFRRRFPDGGSGDISLIQLTVWRFEFHSGIPSRGHTRQPGTLASRATAAQEKLLLVAPKSPVQLDSPAALWTLYAGDQTQKAFLSSKNIYIKMNTYRNK